MHIGREFGSSKCLLVTVIMPVYNIGPYIGEALESLVEQTFRDFEVIVIDDGSRDETLAIVESFMDRLPMSLLRTSGRIGCAGARNMGLEVARGEWIAFLDGDDVWMPEKLELQVALVDKYPDTTLVYTNGYQFDESGDLRLFYRKHSTMHTGNVLRKLYRRNCFYTSSVMVRHSDVESAGLFRSELRFAADYDLWIKLFERGGVARGIWVPLTRYRERPSGNSKNLIGIDEVTIRICTEAFERSKNSAHRRILRQYIAKTQADLHRDRARMMLAEGNIERKALRREVYLSWRLYPKRLRRLAWVVAAFFVKPRINTDEHGLGF